MLIIMLLAFSSFFKILNKNTKGFLDPEEYPEKHYVDEYFGLSGVDSMMSMYLIAIGEFDLDGFS